MSTELQLKPTIPAITRTITQAKQLPDWLQRVSDMVATPGAGTVRLPGWTADIADRGGTGASGAASGSARGAPAKSSAERLVATYGLSGAFYLCMCDRVKDLQKQLTDQIGIIKDRNDQKAAANTQLGRLNTLLEQASGPSGGDETKKVEVTRADGTKLTTSVAVLKAEIDKVKARIDTLNTDNELDMMRTSDLFGKVRVAIEMLSKRSSDDHELKLSMIKNMH